MTGAEHHRGGHGALAVMVANRGDLEILFGEMGDQLLWRPEAVAGERVEMEIDRVGRGTGQVKRKGHETEPSFRSGSMQPSEV